MFIIILIILIKRLLNTTPKIYKITLLDIQPKIFSLHLRNLNLLSYKLLLILNLPNIDHTSPIIMIINFNQIGKTRCKMEMKSPNNDKGNKQYPTVQIV